MNSDHPISMWITSLAASGAVAATILGYVPTVAAIIALVWYLIQIYESATAQRWIATRRIRKIARMKARVLMMEAQARAVLHFPKNFPDDTTEGP